MAPISRMVADTVAVAPTENPDVRAEQARDGKDTKTLRTERDDGRLIADIPLDDIEALTIVRDRTVPYPNDMQEIKVSISIHGMRLPIEVLEQSDGSKGGLD